MKKNILLLLALLIFSGASTVFAQNFLSGGQVHGNFQTDLQYYTNDDVLGINDSTLNGKRMGLMVFWN